ncbi:hypothetical protein PLICRDRAFT_86342 [Plicaturopsis crispa FD-325 SS-3]|nr:hypothetical protein PLICRDRAFT_86342 [Plicaturopsis crispa FD-325 SS-3]
MPITRAAKRKRADSVTASESHAGPSRSPSRDRHGALDSDTETLEAPFASIKQRFRSLQAKLAGAARENAELREQLEAASKHETGSSTRAQRGRHASDAARIKALRNEVERLKKVHKKDRDKIDKLRSKEAEKEAKDLIQDSEVEAIGDSAHGMRKLLRKFTEWMDLTVLEEDEICPVCKEKMEPGSCVSFDCRHMVCSECFPRLQGPENVQCPSCRRKTVREEVERVQHTVTEQWDGLLELASAWATMDKAAGEDTSEEEDEEKFIASESNEANENNEGHAEPESSAADASVKSSTHTPPSSPGPDGTSYAHSPHKEKQRRLELLAEEREKRKAKKR